jgi:hypothetical protein
MYHHPKGSDSYMKYEAVCTECNQLYDIYLFKGGICTWCYSIMGLDHTFTNEEIRVFGEVSGAGSPDIKFKGWWD